MARISAQEAGGQNILAYLDTLAWSEGTSTIKGSDDGYNVLVGGKLFSPYIDHPRILVQLKDKNGNQIMQPNGKPLESTAAGRYQERSVNYDYYKKLLGLSNFGPINQDRIAIQQIKECRAIQMILQGELTQAIQACNHIWASLSGSPYGQRTNSVADLIAQYQAAGGTIT